MGNARRLLLGQFAAQDHVNTHQAPGHAPSEPSTAAGAYTCRRRGVPAQSSLPPHPRCQFPASALAQSCWPNRLGQWLKIGLKLLKLTASCFTPEKPAIRSIKL